MSEYRINTECPYCKRPHILDYTPASTDGVHYAWINCRICGRKWKEGDKDWDSLIKNKIKVPS